MLKVMTAALFAALIVAATSFVPDVSEAVEPPAPQKSLKGDRLPTHAPRPACTQSASPYDEAKCVRDRSQPVIRARETRVVMIDRVPFGLS
jgi:hypothetical protein